jgi:hypothetical protein
MFRSNFLRKRALRPPCGGRRSRPLILEEFEARLCLSKALNPFAYVTSYANNSVMRYNEGSGTPAPARGQTGATFVQRGSGGLQTPLNAAVAPNGDFLADSGDANRVFRYDIKTGAYLDDFIQGSNGGLFFPTGFVFSADHHYFYIASDFNNEIIRFVYDGTHATNPTTFIADSALGSPAGLVFGPDGNIYVGSLDNSTVVRYDGNTGAPLPAPGQSGAIFVPSGSGGLFRPGGVAFGPDGNLYVTSQLTNQIMRYDGTTGAPLPGPGQPGAVFVPTAGGLSDPAGFVFGPGTDPADTSARDFYVISIHTSNVLRFDGQTGAFVDEYIADGSGGLNQPRDIVFGNTDPTTLDYVPNPVLGVNPLAPDAMPPAGISSPWSTLPPVPVQRAESPLPAGLLASQPTSGGSSLAAPAVVVDPLFYAAHESGQTDPIQPDASNGFTLGMPASELLNPQ